MNLFRLSWQGLLLPVMWIVLGRVKPLRSHLALSHQVVEDQRNIQEDFEVHFCGQNLFCPHFSGKADTSRISSNSGFYETPPKVHSLVRFSAASLYRFRECFQPRLGFLHSHLRCQQSPVPTWSDFWKCSGHSYFQLR